MALSEHILIVDDQPENISILIEVLQSLYSLQVAKDGKAALECAGGDPQPDLILLDVMMPDMDGYEVCRRLKSDPATRDIPIIFITALDDPEDEALGFQLGASDYIAKPISPPVVQARVRAHLQLKRVKELLEEQNEALEERVRERTAEVVQAQKERVESLNHFANAMAHQIRNPIMSIGGMAGLLVKRTPDDSPLIEYAQAVREGGLRLESLVNAISQYVTLSAKGTQVISVPRLMDQALSKAREFAEATGRELRCTVELETAMVAVDVGIVVTALLEIFINSMEFSPDGNADLDIRGGVCLFGEDLCVSGPGGARRYGVRIVDHGPGIPEEVLPYVTDPFFTTKAQGVGMGLTKAKRILCDEHGGSLLITGNTDGATGTTVTFDLPLA